LGLMMPPMIPLSPTALAKIYVGFTGFNGAAMAIMPSLAAASYGSAFDDSLGSKLAILMLERQGDAVLGTSILLYLTTFAGSISSATSETTTTTSAMMMMPVASAVAWSTVPYIVTLVKLVTTGQMAALGLEHSRGILTLLLAILLPAANILLQGWMNPAVAQGLLATLFLWLGIAGSVLPITSAGMEGIPIADSGAAWIPACWSLASLCILQHAILMWRAITLASSSAAAAGNGMIVDPQTSMVGFAALLNVLIAAYVGFVSNIPEAVEIPRIGFLVWMILGLLVGVGIYASGE